eukprot:4007455-Alexandrium_andersonii.AAC.1
MSASLVGSEMCIRDRQRAAPAESIAGAVQAMAAGAPRRPHARWKAWRSARLRRPTGPSGPLARRRAEWYASWKWPASTTTRRSWPL